jgi:hypothetical protein
VNPIRIQLGKMPAMLARIIDDLVASESDMVVVGHASGTENPLHLARENGADMLITQDGQGGSPCLDVILAARALSIFAIGRDGRNGSAVSLIRRSVELDAAENAGLAEAIRRVAGGC